MVNKVILIGNLGADPEVRFTPSGIPVATIRVATTEVWKNKDGGKEERTEWHRVVSFRRLAEIMRDHLKKGARVYIEGRNETRKWQDKDGIDRFTTEVIAREMKMLTPKNGGNNRVPPNMDQEIPPPEPPADGEPMGDDVPY